MQDEPTPIELTKSVADFLRNDIAPLISGHQAARRHQHPRPRHAATDAGGGERCCGSGAPARAARDGRLGHRPQPRARRANSEGRSRSRNARPCRASVGDHDGQARGRSAELCIIQAGAGTGLKGAAKFSAVIPGRRGATSPESIARQVALMNGFSDAQLRIVARTQERAPRNDSRAYFPTHFGGRFSENAFGPSM